VNLTFKFVWKKADGLSEEVFTTNTGHADPKTKFPDLNWLTHLQNDCILEELHHNLVPFAKHPQQWLTQWHLQMSWEMLQFEWAEERWEELFTEGNRVRLLSPSVIRVYVESESDELMEEIAAEFKNIWESSQKVLAFIFGSDHWTLLSVQKRSGGELEIRYRCSLREENAVCRKNAELILRSFTNAEIALPTRWNRWFQDVGTGVCGVACLHWAEEELKESRGEGLGGERVNVPQMDGRLRKWREMLCKRRDQWREKEKEYKIHKLPADAPALERAAADKERALALIKEEEKKMKAAGSKPVEFRCSRCRFSLSGVGCDSKYCNPYKWLAKVEKLTEELKAAKEKASEGGAPDVVDLLIAAIAAADEKLRKALAEGTKTHEEKIKAYNMED